MASDADTMNNPQNRKFKCWAAACGGCGEGPSAEHIVSKCLFPEGVVHVSGFDWCKGETKSIGVNGLERQVLCETHNSALSETDAEAKKAIDLFQPTAPPTKGDPLGNNNVDGHKLERCATPVGAPSTGRCVPARRLGNLGQPRCTAASVSRVSA